MDRTAWIAIILCVLGLAAWEIWVARQRMPQPSTTATPPAASNMPSVSPTIARTPVPIASPAATLAAFAENTETLRNSDIELHLTSRGGGISEVVLPNYLAEQG